MVSLLVACKMEEYLVSAAMGAGCRDGTFAKASRSVNG